MPSIPVVRCRCMFLEQAPLTAEQVLQAFQREESTLFLGAAFNTIALICLGFCVARRRWDALLVWLAVFAGLYGERLWLETDILHLTLIHSDLFHRIHRAITFVVPIPAFFFFQAAGLLPRRGKLITWTLAVTFTGLAILALFGRSLDRIHLVNNVIVIVALLWVLVRAYRQGSRDRDFVVLRRGLLCFAVLALWDNVGGAKLLRADLE